MNPKKVVHLTSVHPPFDVRIFHKECVALRMAGYETVLIAPHHKNEVVDDVQIRAVPMPNSRWERTLITTWRVFTTAIREKADLYHFHDPELIPVGILMKVCGKVVVYDAHENLSEDILTKDHIPNVARKLVSRCAEVIEQCGALFFNGVVAATPAIGKQFPAVKTRVVQNYPILSEMLRVTPCSYGGRPPLLAYAGGLTAIKGTKEMVQAMAMLPKDVTARLALAGNFESRQLESDVRRLPGWERVEYLGLRPREEVANLLGKARIGLVLYHPVPNHLEAQPHKLYEYMAAGIPLIASNFPLWREIVQDSHCGIVVDPMSPKAIAEAILWLLEHPTEAEAMGVRGRDMAISRFNWKNEQAKLLELYEKMLSIRTLNLAPEEGGEL